jgi:hypothetical protein
MIHCSNPLRQPDAQRPGCDRGTVLPLNHEPVHDSATTLKADGLVATVSAFLDANAEYERSLEISSDDPRLPDIAQRENELATTVAACQLRPSERSTPCSSRRQILCGH